MQQILSQIAEKVPLSGHCFGLLEKILRLYFGHNFRRRSGAPFTEFGFHRTELVTRRTQFSSWDQSNTKKKNQRWFSALKKLVGQGQLFSATSNSIVYTF